MRWVIMKRFPIFTRPNIQDNENCQFKELKDEYDRHAQVEAQSTAQSGKETLAVVLALLSYFPNVERLEVNVHLEVVFLNQLLNGLEIVLVVEPVLLDVDFPGQSSPVLIRRPS